MSILERLRRRGSGNMVPPNATFRITQTGQEKVQEFGSDPKSRILVALETRGTSDVSEISEVSGLNKGTVERFIPALVRGHYIQYVGGMEGGIDE